MQHWTIAAEFFTAKTGAKLGAWLDDFITDPDLRFTKIPAARREDWHQAARPRTGVRKWLRLISQGARALAPRPHGVITCFPQLAMVVGVLKRLSFSRARVIAHNFNLGGFPGGARRALARFAARGLDIVIVHSPSEVESYGAYLGLPPGRVRFVPLQRGDLTVARAEDREAPFLLAMGSAGRDYATLIAATAPLQIPTVIVTRKDIIARLTETPGAVVAPHVTFRHGLSAEDCMALLARARLTVVPLANMTTASGQVTFINAMRMGVALVATACPGTDFYVEHGQTGVLVPPFDVAALRAAIEPLWQDAPLREAQAARARAFARDHLSDEAAAAALHRLIAELG
jgi:glycosyltransferase involved in cell wall biosynthesis